MRTITALYDSREHAEAARSQLAAVGVEPSAVQITSSDAGASATQPDGHDRGFFQSLKDFFMPDEDRQAYSEGVRRGGYLLTARVDEGRADAVCRILDDSGAIDFDERQQQWRSEGWSGRDEAIPVVEEQLRVGKREVERGGVRVRSYVEETPVEEAVSLRSEHVEIERRPVDERLSAANADELFEERTIELTERGEEAVVAKEAVVREEIGIRKEVNQRTETISDTVRHTEVDVDDTRASDDRRGLAGEPASFRSDDDDIDRSDETEEERRDRLDRERGTTRPSY
jgi:uncharacterized protein (TIGR02271 family)